MNLSDTKGHSSCAIYSRFLHSTMFILTSLRSTHSPRKTTHFVTFHRNGKTIIHRKKPKYPTTTIRHDSPLYIATGKNKARVALRCAAHPAKGERCARTSASRGRRRCGAYKSGGGYAEVWGHESLTPVLIKPRLTRKLGLLLGSPSRKNSLSLWRQAKPTVSSLVASTLSLSPAPFSRCSFRT